MDCPPTSFRQTITHRPLGHRLPHTPGGALILDVYFRAADRVGHGPCFIFGGLLQRDLFFDPCLFADFRLLGMFFSFDHPILKHGIAGAHRTIDRLTLDLDAFIPQIHLLADRRFDHVAANPHAP